MHPENANNYDTRRDRLIFPIVSINIGDWMILYQSICLLDSADQGIEA